MPLVIQHKTTKHYLEYRAVQTYGLMPFQTEKREKATEFKDQGAAEAEWKKLFSFATAYVIVDSPSEELSQ
jgi:hypothetical protein